MLCLPTFFPALVRSNTECETFFTEKNVSAVTGVNGDNCVVLRELTDISLFFVDIATAMKTANPVVTVAENLKNVFAYSCHNNHVENNIDAVGEFDTIFSKWRTDFAH